MSSDDECSQLNDPDLKLVSKISKGRINTWMQLESINDESDCGNKQTNKLVKTKKSNLYQVVLRHSFCTFPLARVSCWCPLSSDCTWEGTTRLTITYRKLKLPKVAAQRESNHLIIMGLRVRVSPGIGLFSFVESHHFYSQYLDGRMPKQEHNRC